jgi:hypothetical protein
MEMGITLLQLKNIILKRNQLQNTVQSEMDELTRKGELAHYSSMPSYSDYVDACGELSHALLQVNEHTT